jgi:hypothetical protein
VAIGIELLACQSTPSPTCAALLAHTLVASSLGDRVALGEEVKGTTSELRRVSSRHFMDSFRDDHRLTHGVRKSGSGSRL